MLKLLLLCSCTQFVTGHCTTVLYISQYCTFTHRDILHRTAWIICGHVNFNIARHYIVVLHNQYCHSHIQMYICIYISVFIVYFCSCNIAVLLYLYLCLCLFCTCLFYNFYLFTCVCHCTGKLAFPHCAHDNKRFES